MNTNLQLSKSSIHSCSSIGYLVRSISQATVEVILGTNGHFLNVLYLFYLDENVIVSAIF